MLKLVIFILITNASFADNQKRIAAALRYGFETSETQAKVAGLFALARRLELEKQDAILLARLAFAWPTIQERLCNLWKYLRKIGFNTWQVYAVIEQIIFVMEGLHVNDLEERYNATRAYGNFLVRLMIENPTEWLRQIEGDLPIYEAEEAEETDDEEMPVLLIRTRPQFTFEAMRLAMEARDAYLADRRVGFSMRVRLERSWLLAEFNRILVFFGIAPENRIPSLRLLLLMYDNIINIDENHRLERLTPEARNSEYLALEEAIIEIVAYAWERRVDFEHAHLLEAARAYYHGIRRGEDRNALQNTFIQTLRTITPVRLAQLCSST